MPNTVGESQNLIFEMELEPCRIFEGGKLGAPSPVGKTLVEVWGISSPEFNALLLIVYTFLEPDSKVYWPYICLIKGRQWPNGKCPTGHTELNQIESTNEFTLANCIKVTLSSVEY